MVYFTDITNILRIILKFSLTGSQRKNSNLKSKYNFFVKKNIKNIKLNECVRERIKKCIV